VANFSAMPHRDYRIGLPFAGRWVEVLNTDSDYYGGSAIGNLGAVTATDQPWHGQPASAAVQVGPLATVWFEYQPQPEPAPAAPAAKPRKRAAPRKKAAS
jgi:1,4-alpha-glucan branching enzyme